MSNYPQIKFVHNQSSLDQSPLHFIANEDKHREIEVRAGGFADYGLTGFPWVSNDAEIASKAIEISHAGTKLMQLFKGYSDNKLYYSRDGKWANKQPLDEPPWSHHRHYHLSLKVEGGALSEPVLRRYRSEETLPVRHVRVMFLTADGVDGVTPGRIDDVMRWSNQALRNSHVPLQLSAVALETVRYASTDDLSQDLGAMYSNVALHARINELRRLFAAEVVALLVPRGGGSNSGIAYLDSFGTAWPFTVMRENAMFSGHMEWLAVHEIAHILGVAHETGYQTKDFRTVMSKDFSVPHIQHLSNPNAYTPAPFKSSGKTTGDAAHDSAAILIAKAAAITSGAPSKQSEPRMSEPD